MPLLAHDWGRRMAELLMDSEHCLSAARDGSREAMGLVLQKCRSYLLRIAQQELDCHLRAKGGASDLVQEAFLEANEAFPRFTGNSSLELRAWLRKILLDRVGKWKRRYRTTEKRRVSRERPLQPSEGPEAALGGVPSQEPSPSVHAMAREQSRTLQIVLERLPEDYREIIKLRYYQNLPFDAIGQVMGRSANAVCLLWLRTIQRLKLELKNGP
jgi:RNA polymerase sigma-70 factor (ECF subfamily)